MAYSRGTGLPINASVKKPRNNPARIRAFVAIPSTGGSIMARVPVARKPARNKARVS